MGAGGGRILGSCTIKSPLFTKLLPKFEIDFCPTIADFCKFFQRWEGCSPCPLSPTPMVRSDSGAIFVHRRQYLYNLFCVFVPPLRQGDSHSANRSVVYRIGAAKPLFHFISFHFKFFTHGYPVNQERLLFRGPCLKS